MSEHKQLVEDAKDRLRSEIDIELRKYRRRFRTEGEEKIANLTADETVDFDPNLIAKLALGHAKVVITGQEAKALDAGPTP